MDKKPDNWAYLLVINADKLIDFYRSVYPKGGKYSLDIGEGDADPLVNALADKQLSCNVAKAINQIDYKFDSKIEKAWDAYRSAKNEKNKAIDKLVEDYKAGKFNVVDTPLVAEEVRSPKD
jgi:hypothetical protein